MLRDGIYLDGNVEPILYKASKVLQKGAAIVVRDFLDKTTPLHLATRHEHNVMFRLLLETVKNLKAKDTRRWTVLHQAVIEGNVAMARILLERGACINS